MLDPRQYIRNSPFDYFQPLQAHLEQPFPRTPEKFWEMEQRLYKTSAQVADQILIMKIVEAHTDF